MAVTQKDVAARAGVSCATVSRVIRCPDAVRHQLANRVYTAMRELGMEIREGELCEEARTNILVVVNDFTYSLYGGFIAGISDLTCQKGLNLVLCNSGGNLSVERASVNTACRGGYAGIIFITAEDSTPYREMVQQISIPVVFLNRKIEGLDYDSVLLSHFETARIAVKNLLARGHRKIAMLSTDTESTNTRAEKAGFIDALLQSGIAYAAAESSIFYYPNTYQGGRDFACRLNQAGMDYSAVYVLSSEQTVGLLMESLEGPHKQSRNVQILALNRSPILTEKYPTLVTMEQPVREMGRKSVEVLLERAAAPQRERMNVLYNAMIDPEEFLKGPDGAAAN